MSEQGKSDLQMALAKLRDKFDELLIAEVQAYGDGGIPRYAGRCGREQTELREAIAEVLACKD